MQPSSSITTDPPPIAIQKLELVPANPVAAGRVETREVLPGEIKDVISHLVSIHGAGRHIEPSDTDHEIIWLFLKGRGTLRTQDATVEVEGETIARAPLGWLFSRFATTQRRHG